MWNIDCRPAMRRIWSDAHKYEVWLRIELLACEAWKGLGRLAPDVIDRMRARARVDPTRVLELKEHLGNEFNAFLLAVGESLDADASHLHRGILGADVKDTALSYRMAEAGRLLFRGFGRLRRALGQQAVRHAHTLMAGRIHGVQEQPTTLGLKLARLYDEMERAAERIAAAVDAACVGSLSGNVGTYHGAPPAIEAYVCRRLQLHPCTASGRSMSRDRHAAVASALAIAGGSLEKLATTLRLLQQTEVREVLEPAPKAEARRGVLWPQRGARACEEVVSIARLLRGHAATAMENQARWHEHDDTHELAEARILPNSFALLDQALDRLSKVSARLVVDEKRMGRNLVHTEANLVSGRLIEALVRAGCDEERAHDRLKRLARRCAREDRSFCAALRRARWIDEFLDTSALEEYLNLAPYARHADWVLCQVGLKAELEDFRRNEATRTKKGGRHETKGGGRS